MLLLLFCNKIFTFFRGNRKKVFDKRHILVYSTSEEVSVWDSLLPKRFA